jgi:hypothetical protein
MQKSVLVILLLLLGAGCFAADTIIVHKDSRLDLLTAKQAEINKKPQRTPGGQYKGYRLQVITTHNRDEANQVKASILQYFPDERTYLSYLSPYFKVKVGNFFSREDAENFKAELSKVYDGGIYIVEDIVEYIPKQDTDTIPAQ